MTSAGNSNDKFSILGCAPPIKIYESAFAQAKVSVCHVQAPPIHPDTIATQGTAALYELADGVFTAATNNHVLPLTDSDFLVRTLFTFERLGQIRLNKGDINCCTSSKALDATVIELSDVCVQRLQQLGAKFIRLTTAREGDKIAMPQYIEGELCFDMGVIHEIKDDELHYYSVGGACSNGSPIVLWDLRAIGMHKQSGTCIEHRAFGPIRRGTSLLAIAVFHLADSRFSGASAKRPTPVRPLLSSSASSLQLIRRIPKQMLIKNGENDPEILGISYNSANDELFLADCMNKVVRAMPLRNNAGDLREVYTAPHDMSPDLSSVCHVSDSDTLLICSSESVLDEKSVNWLAALSRNGSLWRETHRVQTEGKCWNIMICCALSDSRVLIGMWDSTYMELFRLESGPRIARLHCIYVPEKYNWFSATCSSDTLVAMSYEDQSVHVHRLVGDKLEELTSTLMNNPYKLLWLADRLIVPELEEHNESHTVSMLQMSGTGLERLRKLISTSENILGESWCVVNDGFAIFDLNSKDILLYSFA